MFLILTFPLLASLILNSLQAADLRGLRCKNSLINYLHRLESGSNEPLEIFEFRHHKKLSSTFGDQSLKISPVPLMREVFGIYRRPLIAKGAKSLFIETRFVSNLSDAEFIKTLKPNTFYTYILDDEKITFAHTRPGKMRDYASKHAILRDQKKDVRLAGEFWVDEKGVFNFDGASGTFQPTNNETARGLEFFRDHLGIKNAKVHYFDPTLITQKEIVPPIIPNISLSKVGNKILSTTVRYSTAEKAVAYQIEYSDGKMITLENEKGKKVQYKIVKQQMNTRSETLYDSDDLSLHKQNSELWSSSLVDESRQAVRMARKMGIGMKDIHPQLMEEQNYTTYFAYPVIAGKVDETDAVFQINVNKINYVGLSDKLNGKRATSFEIRVEAHESILNKFQEHFHIDSSSTFPRVSAIEALKAAP